MAAALGFMDIFSLVTGALGVVQFGMDNFQEPDSVGSIVTVAVGLNYEGGLQDSDGHLPDVRLWNAAGDFLGMKADPGFVEDGGQGEIKVPHYEKDSSQQAPYALFSANSNAICLAYTTITWPDGNKYAWDGSWADACELPWFHSNVYIKGTSWKPPCLWIDSNGDYPITGFQLHWTDFVSPKGETLNTTESQDALKSKICGPNNAGSTSFKVYYDDDPNSIVAIPLKNKSRRTTSARPINGTQPHNQNSTSHNPHANKLIISNDPAHSVAKLCESKTSVGPDFANTAEGLFCRMSDKTMWPICGGHIKDKCFNINTKQLVVGGKATRSTPYGDIGDWTTT